MRDDVSDIGFFYNNDRAREHSRLEENQLEYELTWRYLDRYLPAQGSILEVNTPAGIEGFAPVLVLLDHWESN